LKNKQRPFPLRGNGKGAAYWLGGDAYSAPVLAVKQGSSIQYFYLLRDYLGSITHVVDASYDVVFEFSFDACSVKTCLFVSISETKSLVEQIPISEAFREGRRRDKDTWKYTLNSEPDLFAGRGFTSHSLSRKERIGKYLPYFNLYNMNGRLYDPLVGRFLSPDNYVQLPDFTQNFNRYSYALNNPLKYTDPTGELFGIDDAVEFIVGGIINVIYNAGEIDNFWEGLGYFVSGGAGAWVTAQSFGLAAPVGAAITTFGNNLLETDFLTKEKGYSFKSISGDQWKKIGGKTLIGFATGYLGDKIGGKIADKINFKSEFWNLASERMIKGGITNGSYSYFNSTIVDGNKWNSDKALNDLSIGFGSGIAMGFAYTVVEQKIVIPEFENFKQLNWEFSFHLKVNHQNYNFIMRHTYNPLMPQRMPVYKPSKPIYLPDFNK